MKKFTDEEIKALISGERASSYMHVPMIEQLFREVLALRAANEQLSNLFIAGEELRDAVLLQVETSDGRWDDALEEIRKLVSDE